MKRIKRFASLLLALALAVSLAVGCFAQDAVITRGEAAKLLLTAADDYCPDLKTEDILKGYPDGTLEEDGPLTYAQALIMIDRAFGGLPVPIGDSARTAAGAQGFHCVGEPLRMMNHEKVASAFQQKRCALSDLGERAGYFVARKIQPLVSAADAGAVSFIGRICHNDVEASGRKIRFGVPDIAFYDSDASLLQSAALFI